MGASLLHLHATRSKRIGTLTSGLMSPVEDKVFEWAQLAIFYTSASLNNALGKRTVTSPIISPIGSKRVVLKSVWETRNATPTVSVILPPYSYLETFA